MRDRLGAVQNDGGRSTLPRGRCTSLHWTGFGRNLRLISAWRHQGNVDLTNRVSISGLLGRACWKLTIVHEIAVMDKIADHSKNLALGKICLQLRTGGSIQ
jgi:hypothetical protein